MLRYVFTEQKISIHAPARGATQSCQNTITATVFQSTLPRGERLPENKNKRPIKDISIHAPARGATCYGFCFHA